MRHVGSSQIGDQTASSVLIGRWIFNHWTTREIPPVCFNCYVLFHYMDKPCFINPPIGGHLEYLSFLVMKISVMNRFLYIKDRVGRVLRHGQLDLNCLLPVAVCRGWICFHTLKVCEYSVSCILPNFYSQCAVLSHSVMSDSLRPHGL